MLTLWTLKVQRRDVLMPSGRVRSFRYCPEAGAVLLIASLITPVIFNLPLPPRAYLKRAALRVPGQDYASEPERRKGKGGGGDRQQTPR